MNTLPLTFDGSIPQNYETYLTPFLFDPYARDLVERINIPNAKKVLELACGTGIVTRQLLQHLPSGTSLTATDLEPGMLEVAKNTVDSPAITWAAVDMTDMPYEDNQFDLVICQFGVMLVPDKLKAISEMQRVLKNGGQLLFSVWGNIHENGIWNISGDTIHSFLGINPITQVPGPFSMSDETETLRLLSAAGFIDATATGVNKTGFIDSAALAAKGFIEGLPVSLAIRKKDPALLSGIIAKLEEELSAKLGDHPVASPLHALIFEATK